VSKESHANIPSVFGFAQSPLSHRQGLYLLHREKKVSETRKKVAFISGIVLLTKRYGGRLETGVNSNDRSRRVVDEI
jgi:hypothetical protein